MITQYRPRILSQLQDQISRVDAGSVLDFGSGDGYFATHVAQIPSVLSVTPVDVVERPNSLVKPIVYDGNRLPFEDGSFDLVYSVDVIHHCLDPSKAIEDIIRCTRRFLLIKDHTYHTQFGRAALALLDEIGNRRFGIPSPYLYQQDWEWLEHIQQAGFKQISFIHPMRCQSGLLAWTNTFQFMTLWERR